MQVQQSADRQVLEVIVRSPGTALDDIVLECPDLTWNQVFIAIDRLSRDGALKLTPKGHGLYTVHLSNDALEAAQYQIPTKSPSESSCPNRNQFGQNIQKGVS